MSGIETWNIISPILYRHLVAEPNEFKDVAMDVYIKTYFALKDLDEKEKKEKCD